MLERVPADRLRSTSRERLRRITATLGDADTATVRDLREKMRTLTPFVDVHGRSTTV